MKKENEKEKNVVPKVAENTSDYIEKEVKKDSPDSLKKAIDEIQIPQTKMIPAPMKVFCIEIELQNMKTSSGLILPTSYKSGNKQTDRKTLSRFFVVAVGDKVKEWTFDGKKIEVGDELLYHDVEDAIGVKHPIVTDYDLLDRKGLIKEYVVLDITEFAGIIKHEKAD